MPKKRDHLNGALSIEQITITPEMAVAMLESNKINRPLNDAHVKRIARQITEGRWIVNGDSIKFTIEDNCIDGQHRLWAVIEANKPIESIVVRGIKGEAFSTIDTLRKTRSPSDLLFLHGAQKYRQIAAGALQWLVRMEHGVLEQWKQAQNRVENADVLDAYERHPGIMRAAERASQIRFVCTPSLMAFIYYMIARDNEPLAHAMIETLADASGTAPDDPFYLLRNYLVTRTKTARDPLVTIALAFKAANVAYRKRKLPALLWRRQGAVPEPFPELNVRD